jgi:hypothetical protein
MGGWKLYVLLIAGKRWNGDSKFKCGNRTLAVYLKFAELGEMKSQKVDEAYPGNVVCVYY